MGIAFNLLSVMRCDGEALTKWLWHFVGGFDEISLCDDEVLEREELGLWLKWNLILPSCESIK